MFMKLKQVLHLEDNLMTRIEGWEFGNLTSLRELYLERNRLVQMPENLFPSLLMMGKIS